jgi:hypothetical protein
MILLPLDAITYFGTTFIWHQDQIFDGPLVKIHGISGE